MASAACRRLRESFEREQEAVMRCLTQEASNALRNEFRRTRARCRRAGRKAWATLLEEMKDFQPRNGWAA